MTRSDDGFSAAVDRTPDEVSVAFVGELDMATVAEASTVLRAAISSASNARVVVDLSGVTFMDSSGLKLLVQTTMAMTEENGAKLALRGITEQVALLFEVTNADAVFDLDP